MSRSPACGRARAGLRRQIKVRTLLWILLFTLPAYAEGPAWSYRMRVDKDLTDLYVQASFARPSSSEVYLPEDAAPYLSNLECQEPDGWVPVQGTGNRWKLPGDGPWKVRYRLHLNRMAREQDQEDVAYRCQDAILTAPSNLLLSPYEALPGHDFQLEVDSPVPFATGLTHVGPNLYRAPTGSLDQSPICVLGSFKLQEIPLKGGTLELAYIPGGLQLPDDELVRWVTRTAGGVADYYGRFPVPRALLVMFPRRGSHWGTRGVTLGGGGASVMVLPSPQQSARAIADDWTLAHELSHLGFPGMAYQHHWIEEGMATYVEPIIRARLGQYPRERVWKDLIEGLPLGEPKAGDRGLDHTRTWGRVYWGGALYWFLADVKIRLATENRHGVKDAFRGIVAAGGSLEVEWPIEKALKAGDAAVGGSVLLDLYHQMADQPVFFDLNPYWQKLGVRLEGDTAVFFEAPWSNWRDSVTN